MKTTPWIFLSVILFALLCYMSCGKFWPPAKPCQTGDTLSHASDTIYLPADTVVKKIPYRVPVPYYIQLPADTFFAELSIDTAELIADYYSTRHYNDTIEDDTSFRAIMALRIRENRIVSFDFWHQNLRATQIINNTTVVSQEYSNIYGGILVGPDMAAPFVQFTKNRTTAIAAFNVTNNLPLVGLGYRFK